MTSVILDSRECRMLLVSMWYKVSDLNIYLRVCNRQCAGRENGRAESCLFDVKAGGWCSSSVMMTRD